MERRSVSCIAKSPCEGEATSSTVAAQEEVCLVWPQPRRLPRRHGDDLHGHGVAGRAVLLHNRPSTGEASGHARAPSAAMSTSFPSRPPASSAAYVTSGSASAWSVVRKVPCATCGDSKTKRAARPATSPPLTSKGSGYSLLSIAAYIPVFPPWQPAQQREYAHHRNRKASHPPSHRATCLLKSSTSATSARSDRPLGRTPPTRNAVTARRLPAHGACAQPRRANRRWQHRLVPREAPPRPRGARACATASSTKEDEAPHT